VEETELESGFDYEVVRELMQMGHKVVFKMMVLVVIRQLCTIKTEKFI
jgi:hypothetical protein